MKSSEVLQFCITSLLVYTSILISTSFSTYSEINKRIESFINIYKLVCLLGFI